MSQKKQGHKSFFQRLAAAFVGDDTGESLAAIDAKTTEGENIRVDAAGIDPAVGDPVYIIDTETGEPGVAPDNDYTIAGGDYDGYKLTVVSGKISAIYNPNESSVDIQQSQVKSYKAMQAENKRLNEDMQKWGKKFTDLQEEIKELKKRPLENHTIVTPEDEDGGGPDLGQEYFSNRPWNKRKKKTA